MRREILYGADFCAVTENGRLVEYIPLEDADQAGAGSLVLGRVDRLMPGLDCAFVDVGRKKSGFLPMKEDSRSFRGGPLRSGETLLLQIRKEETGEKGVFLTRDVSLPGTGVILMPMNRFVGVSGRIADETERQRLRETGKRIAGDRFGLVMRLAAERMAEEALRQETEALLEKWERLLEKSRTGKAGDVLHRESEAERLAADYRGRGIDGIREVPALDAELSRQLKAAGERRIALPGGGNLVLDRCEAMTVIDVNTASDHSGQNKAATVLETNLEACESAAEQIRLRNLSGIVILDMIDMAAEEDREQVLERLRQCFARDRVKTVIHGWTRLGLIEMTRKRGRGEMTL